MMMFSARQGCRGGGGVAKEVRGDRDVVETAV